MNSATTKAAIRKILNNIRTLRTHAREATLETQEEMLAKLAIIVEEHRDDGTASSSSIIIDNHYLL